MAPAPIITFYSYKGGTGRSMGLANTAWILASNGLRVLAVDWDLEAPGLHRFFHPFLPDRDLRFCSGVIDLMWEFATAAADPAEHEPGWHEELAVLAPYVMSVEYDFPGPGTLDLLPAGRQNHLYASLVTSFDWTNFYENLGGGGFLEALKRRMRAEYDYILIDSRTGLSDTAGICTVQLPDILVDCFSLSTQAIDGAAAVAASVHRQRGPAQLRLFPVPMRVEDGEQDKLEASRDYARARFGPFLSHVPDPERYWGEVEVPYRRYYAYEEILATIGDRPQQDGTILAVTERIAGYLTGDKVTSLGTAVPEQERRRLLALFQRGRTAAPGEARLPGAGSPRVFITFAYESAERFEAVRELWFLLRGHGIDARLDLAPGQRQPDWRDWLTKQLGEAQVVLVVSSPGWRRQADDELYMLSHALGTAPRASLAVVLPGDAYADLPKRMRPEAAEPVTLAALTAEGTEPLALVIEKLVPRAVSVRPADTATAAWWEPRPEAPASLSQQAAEIGRAVAVRCNAGRVARDMYGPDQLAVRWSGTSRLAAAAPAAEPASGTEDEITGAFLASPRGRLVLLGEPGSGKTILAQALMLSLLGTRADTKLIPVPLSAASWQPGSESLTEFVARQLHLDYGVTESTARDLASGGRIVPVIDGLDELPLQDMISAIGMLNRYSAPVAAFVVTCRAREYERVVSATGLAISGAVVVSQQPVSQADAQAFLSSSAVGDDTRWPRLFTELADQPDGPVARALTSPLYLWLARETYRSPRSDPEELLALPSQAAVERQLARALIPASYALPPATQQTSRAARRSRSYAVNAEKWLSFLAVRMREQGTAELAWWELPRMLRRGLLAFLLCAVSLLLLGWAADIAYALVTGPPSLRVSYPALVFGSSAVIAALATAVIPWASRSPAARTKARSPASARSSLGGAVDSLNDGATITIGFVIAASILGGLAGGATAFLADSRSSWLAAGGGAILVATGAAAVPLAWRTAWIRYAVAVTFLGLTSRVPLRLLRFLEDARQRGLLRRTGAVYQFRYPALQDLLGREPRSGGTSEERHT